VIRALRLGSAATTEDGVDRYADLLRRRVQLTGAAPGARLARVTCDPLVDAAVIAALEGGPWSLVLVDGRLPAVERQRRIAVCGASHQVRDDLCLADLDGDGVDSDASVHIFTSGTTGPARTTPLSWPLLHASAAAVSQAVDLRRGDLWACALPLSHVAGLGVLLRCWSVGATPWLLDDAAPATLTGALDHGATHASLVARNLAQLLETVPARPLSSSLRCLMVGGGRTDPTLVARARAAGLPAVTTYGLSEAGSTVTLHRAGELPCHPGDAGWPLPHVSLRLDGDGQLFVRTVGGPEIPTGDFGRVEPDGRLVVLDRRSDRIVSGGENVSPDEVERVLGSFPGVQEACVVGVPDPQWGQRVAAAVRWSDAPRVQQLEDWARGRLAAWQRPREIHLWSGPLPRNALGKLLRREVRDRLSPGR
jgi:o-succinylbenzoate---CoA ligase